MFYRPLFVSFLVAIVLHLLRVTTTDVLFLPILLTLLLTFIKYLKYYPLLAIVLAVLRFTVAGYLYSIFTIFFYIPFSVTGHTNKPCNDRIAELSQINHAMI
jgi:hypothetical protein